MTQPITPTPADREAWEKFGPMIFYGDITGPEAFARHAAAARDEGYRAGIEAAVADIETWFPGNTMGRPQYAAAKTLRDSVAALALTIAGGQGA